MPIKPENRILYPKNWKEISKRVRYDLANNKCEICGVPNKTIHPVTGSKVVLTVAHLDQNPRNCKRYNLRAMCQRCHINFDHYWRKMNKKGTFHSVTSSGDKKQKGV